MNFPKSCLFRKKFLYVGECIWIVGDNMGEGKERRPDLCYSGNWEEACQRHTFFSNEPPLCFGCVNMGEGQEVHPHHECDSFLYCSPVHYELSEKLCVSDKLLHYIRRALDQPVLKWATAKRGVPFTVSDGANVGACEEGHSVVGNSGIS